MSSYAGLNTGGGWQFGRLFPRWLCKLCLTLPPPCICGQAGLTDVAWADLGEDPAAGSVGKCLKFPNAADFHPVSVGPLVGRGLTPIPTTSTPRS